MEALTRRNVLHGALLAGGAGMLGRALPAQAASEETAKPKLQVGSAFPLFAKTGSDRERLGLIGWING
jgi:hypothetical protein